MKTARTMTPVAALIAAQVVAYPDEEVYSESFVIKLGDL